MSDTKPRIHSKSRLKLATVSAHCCRGSGWGDEDEGVRVMRDKLQKLPAVGRSVAAGECTVYGQRASVSCCGARTPEYGRAGRSTAEH